MKRARKPWLRGVLTLGLVGAVAASLLISPAGAHITTFGHLKGHIKKIARKIARREATTIVQTTVGPTVFIEETELVRFGQVKLNVGAAAQTVGTFGPFTLRAECNDSDPTATVSIESRVTITTSENNSIVDTDDDGDDDFDVGETIVWGGGDFGAAPGDPADSWSEETEGHAAAPGGTAIDGRTAVYSNFAGSHCVLAGYVIQTAPQA